MFCYTQAVQDKGICIASFMVYRGGCNKKELSKGCKRQGTIYYRFGTVGEGDAI